MTVLLTGFLTCLAIIVAIGPQSAWLLRQGLRRDRVVLAVLCCLVGDALLIALGTAGVGAVLDYAPWLLEALRWVGVAYLSWFAYRSFRSALAHKTTQRNTQKHDDADAGPASTVHVTMTSQVPVVSPADDAAGGGDAGPATSTRQKVQVTHVSKISTVAGTALTLSIINPHAWVDSLVVLGTMANSFTDQRWFFAVGAFVACIVWHAVLAGGGSALAGWLDRPRTWQVIDAGVGVIVLLVAALLAFSGF